MKAITVAELIAFLLTQPQELPVAYCLYSEQCLMDLDDISIEEACKPREDGWIQDKRPDKETQSYLLFPGN